MPVIVLFLTMGFGNGQAVLDQLAKFNAPPTETLSPANGRNIATVKNALEEMAADSALIHSNNLLMPIDSQMNSPSYTEQAEAKPLNAAMMHWFWRHYLNHQSKGKAYAQQLAKVK